MNLALSQDVKRNFGSQYIRTDRDNEYLAFSRVTQKLQKAIEDSDHPPMIEAIYANNQLWTALAADLAHPENGLPAETKAGLLSLAIFSLKQGRRVVEERLSAISLVEINLRVMKGLRGEIK
ncbi:flagellar biosynthesis regulator FlaF [Paracoccus sp. PS-1]|uniref:flagellar biosynthesis regulator FlaF n=1 Tax=unclassified Paracoccus (in: a-proteobacteria) TaxID=2688777 RepID=UPI0018DDBCB1|nr:MULTISPECIES: flagellar biosynthesis regulator FlaF [unclassified Paracoccus (in: a-proteobacteria)]MDQ7263701.1 flagellar biosynthesis regulator FlaF [Paracoccus sp. PS1]